MLPNVTQGNSKDQAWVSLRIWEAGCKPQLPQLWGQDWTLSGLLLCDTSLQSTFSCVNNLCSVWPRARAPRKPELGGIPLHTAALVCTVLSKPVPCHSFSIQERFLFLREQ